jgi:hypothetical protein
MGEVGERELEGGDAMNVGGKRGGSLDWYN